MIPEPVKYNDVISQFPLRHYEPVWLKNYEVLVKVESDYYIVIGNYFDGHFAIKEFRKYELIAWREIGIKIAK